MILIFDIEANGLLDTVSKIHCIEAEDIKTGKTYSFGPNNIKKGLKLLERAETIAGHNIKCYDIPALKRVYPHFNPKARTIDTLNLSKLIYTNLKDRDFLMQRKMKKRGDSHYFEGTKLWGSHSLKAWGLRLGVLKDTFADDNADVFDKWTPALQEYCKQDVQVTKELLNLLLSMNYDNRAIDIEMDFQDWMFRMEQHGWSFDEGAAIELYSNLSKRRNRIEEKLQEAFKPIKIEIPFTPKVNNKKLGYEKGVPMVKVRYKEFKPSSHQSIAEHLKNKYGWKPKHFTPTGKPRIDEDVLNGVPYPEAKLLVQYFKMTKVIGRVAEGPKAWLKVMKDGRVHPSINTNGTVTGRCTHSIIVNVTRTKEDKESGGLIWGEKGNYGADQRSLFTVPKDKKDPWVLMGADAKGLELRCLAHYLAKYDGGSFVNIILGGDPHMEAAEITGLPRDKAKNFRYAYLYGAGDAELGSHVNGTAKDGKRLRERFEKGSKGLKELKDALKRKLCKPYKDAYGNVKYRLKRPAYLNAIDGRRVYITSQHTDLNYLLQSCGSIIVKKVTILFCEKMDQEFKWGEEWAIVGHFHDEFQVQVRKRIVERAKELALESFKEAGEFFNFRCPIEGDVKVGLNWAETH